MREIGGRKNQKKDKEQRERLTEQLLKDYVDTFGSAHGQRVLGDILRRCFFFSSTFTGNSATFKNEGKREVALSILGAIQLQKPELVAQIITTNQELKKLFTKGEKK